MINYYFFNLLKKTDRIVDRPVGVRLPEANGGTSSVFLNLNRLRPINVDRVGP
jgi:hypothetical protein